jgi:hypothetical protein
MLASLTRLAPSVTPPPPCALPRVHATYTLCLVHFQIRTYPWSPVRIRKAAQLPPRQQHKGLQPPGTTP